jgi:hypothetical protein
MATIKTNRRSFLKLLSVSPAIFQAPKVLGKISEERPKEWLSEPELLQAATSPPPKMGGGDGPSELPKTGPAVIIRYPGKQKGTGGYATYNEVSDMTTHYFFKSGTFDYNGTVEEWKTSL